MQSNPLSVLLVEHDAATAHIIRGLLESAREAVREIHVAPDLTTAANSLAAGEIDVVLLEFFLPDGAGPANITLLRNAAPQIPIIALGNVEDEAVAVEAVHAGAQEYLAKPQLNTRWLVRSMSYAIERRNADQAWVEAEAKYRSLFNHLVEGIFRTSPDGQYLLANNALARIYGYASPEELMSRVTDIGRRLYVQPGRRAEFKRIMEEHDTITAFESQIYRKDGSSIWISENCHAVRDAQGRLLYYEGTVEDITQRREVEEDLRHSEALYHSLVETSPQNIFRKDVHCCFTFANQQFCKTLGVPLEEIVGRTDYDFFPPEMAAKFQRDDREVLQQGKTIEAVEENQPTGKPKVFVQVVKTPLRGAYGQIIGLQGIFWDITAQKLTEERIRQAQESLRESEALYHSLVETMPQGVFRRDLEGRFTFVNQPYCKYHGIKPEDLIGKTDFDLYPRAAAEKYWADDLRVIQNGETMDVIEESRPVAVGETRYLHVIKSPLRDAGGTIIGLQGMFWDISEQKLAEQRLRRANEELAASQEKLRLRNEQMEENLKMAGEIQAAMLPQQLPTFPRGVALADSAFQFTHRYRPAGAVGGDFFNVTALSDTRAGVFICDVAGHDVRSALVTAMIRALLEELRPLAHDPGHFLTKLNQDLGAILNHAGTPVLTTAFYLVADSGTGILRFANAGHPRPLLIRRGAGQVEPMANASGKSQAALGVFERTVYHTTEIMFSPRDLVMLFTDGLYEVQNPAGELYTQALLSTAAQAGANLPTSRLFDQLLEEIRHFAGTQEFDDDVCLVGLERAG